MTSEHDKVLDHTRLQLSALFDGELGMDEARFLQRRLEHDRALVAAWSRWQLAGDALRGQATAAAPAGFAERVAAAVAGEGGVHAGARSQRRYWVPGAALAASVAALAMFMARQAPDQIVAPAAPQVEIASAAQPAPAELPTAPETPAPQQPSLPDHGAQVAAAAVAVAEVPRRASERRSRGQQQRAAATRVERNAPAPVLVANADAPAATGPASVDAVASPFTPAEAAGAITTRPWPRALLPDAGSAFSVGYGRLQPVAPAAFRPFEPFQRELPDQPSEDATQVNSEDLN